MADLGQKKTEKELKELQRKLNKVYKEAQKDLKAKLKDFTAKHKELDAHKRELVAQGKMTKAQYKAWQQGQVFQSNQWKSKVHQMAESLVHVEESANRIVHEGQIDCFADNANFFEYSIDKDTGFGGNFSLYDSATVARLIKEDPELLPRREVNGTKSEAWNVKTISNCVVQGIIQGESIPDIAKRIARDTASTDMKAMVRYARTAMTGAQNAGRLQAMREGARQGIEVKKMWLSTLDDRTRDAHQELDGQIADIDKPFDSMLGPIMYPGDPAADEANIWNCRCALGYEYKDSPSMGMRYDQEEGEDIADMTYDEWERSKKAGVKDDLSAAKLKLFDIQKLVYTNDAQHVFSGIWKDDVTYADYFDKESAIQAKRDYFQIQLEKAIMHGDKANMQKFRNLMNELDLFEQKGAQNWQLLNQLQNAKNAVEKIVSQLPAAEPKKAAQTKSTAGTGNSPFTPDAYSQARKDAALWAKNPRDADNALRDKTGEVWRAATPQERDAIYEYTQSYHKFNEPLRGIEYGTNEFKGVGNTDLNARYADNGKRLNAMTDIINKCTYDQDIWLQRGCGYRGMDKFFQVSMDLLQNGTENELRQALMGKICPEYGFCSTGSSKGQGFSSNPIILNIYAPKGTKMMYVEPFSAFGRGGGENWDGKSKQNSFGVELETILQQGTEFRVTKVERNSRGGTIYCDVEVVAQDKQQRWTK